MDSINKRLDEIDREITRLHIVKIEHRKGDINVIKHKDLSIKVPHCYQCEMWTYEQNDLRLERKALIEKKRMLSEA